MPTKNRADWRVCFVVVSLIAVVGGERAIAAEKPAKVDWKAQVDRLSKPADDEVVLTVTGDAIWNRSLANNKDQGLQSLFDIIRASDISFTNFEQVMADSGVPTKDNVSMANPSMVSDFTWAGLDLVSLANNHLMDFGLSGLETTVRVLDQNGIAHAGAGRTLAEALRPAVIEKKGLRVAMLAFMVAPGFERLSVAASPTTPGTAPIRGTKVRLANGKIALSPWDDDLKAMEGAIKEARKSADFVAVSMHMHWPGEENDVDGRQLIAHAAIDAGADAVLGTGPRVVNGIELYKNQPIFYGIGNLAFQFTPEAYELFPDTQKFVRQLLSNPKHFEGLAVRMTLSKSGKPRRIELLPIRQTKDGAPFLAAAAAGDAILEDVTARSEKLGTTIRRQSWYAVIDLATAGKPSS